MANINRRAKDVDGRVSIGLNPEGPVDRRFNLIRLTARTALIALVANYAMHGTVMNGQNLRVSGDGPGTCRGVPGRASSARPSCTSTARPATSPPSIRSIRAPARTPVASSGCCWGIAFCPPHSRRLGPGTATSRSGTARRWSRRRESRARLAPEPRGVRAAKTPDGRSCGCRSGSSASTTRDMVGPVEMFCEIAMDVREQSPFASTDVLRVHERLVRISATAKGFEEGGYETAHLTVHAPG